MKRLIALLFVLLTTTVALTAQRQQDFADRFHSLYGEKYELTCRTISPQMMDRILQLDNVENDQATADLLSQIKSVRFIVHEADTDETRDLYDKAIALATSNSRRYTFHSRNKFYSVYTRRHRKQLVEVVVIGNKYDRTAVIISLTGNLSNDFLTKLSKSES